MTDVIWLFEVSPILRSVILMFGEKKIGSPSFCAVALKEDLNRKSVFIHFPGDFEEAIYGRREMETGECHGPAYRME